MSPIVLCLDRLPELCEQPKTCAYIDTVFGGIETTRKDILVDFFKSAFDGSGADNFFDAGSCIDGKKKKPTLFSLFKNHFSKTKRTSYERLALVLDDSDKALLSRASSYWLYFF